MGYALNQMLDNVSNALEARQESEMKVRQFVADASHELRTPLTAIRGYTELMRMTEHFTPDGEKSLARVQSQSERMTTLVEDLLLLARLDEGQPLKLSDVDLTQLAIETVSDEKVMAPDRSLAAGAPGRARGGPRRRDPAPPGPGQPPVQCTQAHRRRGPLWSPA